MAKLSSCLHWLLVGSRPEVFCAPVTNVPVGFPGTAFLYSALQELIIKDAHVLEGSLAKDQNLLKAPLELWLYAMRKHCPDFVVADGRGQPDTTGAFLVQHAHANRREEEGTRGWTSSLRNRVLADRFCGGLPPASAIYRRHGQNPALQKTVWHFKRGLFQAPCFRKKTSQKQDPLLKPADVGSKPEVRRSNPIRSIQRGVDHWISQRAAGKVGSADLPHLDRGPGRLSTPERRAESVEPLETQTARWTADVVPVDHGFPGRLPCSRAFAHFLLHQRAHADAHLHRQRCPLSATMNRSASKERHKLLFLSLSSKLNMMPEATLGPSFQGIQVRSRWDHEYGFQNGLPSEGLAGVQNSNVGTPVGLPLALSTEAQSSRVDPRRWFSRHPLLYLVDTWTDITASAAV
ncbi:hypothetical protein N431DRAFT_448854 [Stipitochalara longipes BDJ]|nr:hypothetical protein N431DRAFT_448854 [Stipitochalara longipes BDJ]